MFNAIPHSTAVWVVLIVCVALAILYALLRGGGFAFRSGKTTLRANPAPAEGNVLDDAKIKSNAKLGNVIGVKANSDIDPALLGKRNVLNHAVIEGGQIGDITGADLTGQQHTPKK